MHKQSYPLAEAMLERYKPIIEAALEKYLMLPAGPYGVVLDAMRYSLTGGGKRIRPVLTLEFCRLTGGDPEAALPLGAALEMIHTYSLIHDDLPCMDNDDFRRGRPACHKAFGEDIALLAGDGLLTLAFQTALSAGALPAERAVEATSLLARAAGAAGMIGGQVMDLANQGGTADLETLRETDRLKTGALIRAAAEMGCIAAGASEGQRAAAVAYAAAVGLAFQIVDDMLDLTGDPAALGKATGSDAANGKCTYVSLLGLEGAAYAAKRLQEEAVRSLEIFGGEADGLREMAAYLTVRRS